MAAGQDQGLHFIPAQEACSQQTERFSTAVNKAQVYINVN